MRNRQVSRIVALLAVLAVSSSVSAFASDRYVYAVSGKSTELIIIDLESGMVDARLELPQYASDSGGTGLPSEIFATPGGAFVFVLHDGAREVSVVNAVDRVFERTLEFSEGVPMGFYFTPMGDTLYVVFATGTSVYGHRRSELSPELSVELGTLRDNLDFNRRGTRIYSADSSELVFWLRKDHSEIGRVETGDVTDWIMSPTFRFLAGVTTGSSELVIVDENRKRVAKRIADISPSIEPSFSESGDSIFVVGDGENEIRWYDMRRFRGAVLTSPGHIFDMTVSDDGQILAIIDLDSAPTVGFFTTDSDAFVELSDFGQPLADVIDTRLTGDVEYVRLRSGEGFACF